MKNNIAFNQPQYNRIIDIKKNNNFNLKNVRDNNYDTNNDLNNPQFINEMTNSNMNINTNNTNSNIINEHDIPYNFDIFPDYQRPSLGNNNNFNWKYIYIFLLLLF